MGGELYQFNINGLKCYQTKSYNSKVNEIKSILDRASTTLLNIQETHIPNEKSMPKFLTHYNHLFDFRTSFSRTDDPSSGILICINKTENINHFEVLEPGRLVFLKLENKVTKEVKNIFSGYFKSGNSAKQKELIDEIKAKVISDPSVVDKCIILGDFNFVTNILDRNNPSLNCIDKETAKVWEPFESAYNFQDAFRLTNPKKRIYSFTSRANKKLKSRIDRCYLSQDLCGKVISSSYISSNSSDHRIYKIRLANEIEKGPGLWIFNNQLLKDSIFINSIKNIISIHKTQNLTENVRFNWDFVKQEAINFSKTFSREKALKEKNEISNLNRELENLEQLHPTYLNESILRKIETVKEKIDVFRKVKYQGTLLRSKFPTFEKHEPGIAFLRSLEKRKGEENTIFSIYDEETKNLVNDNPSIIAAFENYFKKLYTREEEDQFFQGKLLSKVDVKIDEDKKIELDKKLDEKELFEALKQLKDNKSPGPDGLTKEFYVEFWDDLKILYMKCIDDISQKGELTEMQKRGAIKTNFKKGDRTRIKNYRPISLLNIDLKIITKALANRLKPILHKVIHDNQTCIPGRRIETNIHLMQNLIDHVNEADGNLAIIFLDQEKAFDRMSHSFILKTLEKFGFGKYFIKWIETLNNDSKSFVKVNGFETFEFDLERGVRQGCPLSGFLYILAAEVLAINIRKNKSIKGFKYGMRNLKPLEHKLSQFADDTSVSVSTLKSIEELFKLLKEYEKATNAKINNDKTEGLWVGKWRTREDKPYNIVWKNDHVKFLGIHIGNKVGANGTKDLSDLNYAEQVEKIKNKINYWKRKGISLLGRVKIANVFILSRLWYRTRFFTISRYLLNKIEQLIRNFIWEDKLGGRVRQEVLNLSYEEGGFQLVDITIKTTVQNIQRIINLMNHENKNFEMFLINSLIGKSTKYQHDRLSFGLVTNLDRIKLIKEKTLRDTLTIVNKLDIKMTPGNIKYILDEPLFYNPLLKDTNGETFKIPVFEKNKQALPKTIGDLKQINKNLDVRSNTILRDIKHALTQLNYSGANRNSFFLNRENQDFDISDISFKELYILVLADNKISKEWEGKWESYLSTEVTWKEIWRNIHSNMHNPYTKSAIWETIHLNFWSGHKARENCKLCGEVETSDMHITNECKTLFSLIRSFKINDFYNSKLKVTFGVKDHISTNFVFFIIKKVIFRARFKEFVNQAACIQYLLNKCKREIRNGINTHFVAATHFDKINAFKENFMSNPNYKICELINGKLVLSEFLQ